MQHRPHGAAPVLVFTRQYRALMGLMGRFIKLGARVDCTTRIDQAEPKSGAVYERMSLTIQHEI